MEFSNLVWLASTGSMLLLVAGFFLYIIFHWSDLENLALFIVDIPSMVTDLRTLPQLRRNIQVDLNHNIDSLDNEVPGLFSASAKVEWLADNAIEPQVNVDQGDKLFIRIREGRDQDRAYVTAAMALIERATLLDTRQYFHASTMRAIELKLADRFVSNTRFRGASGYFRRLELDPVLERHSDTARIFDQLEIVDESGLFTRIFLNQCLSLTTSLGSHHASRKIRYEINNLIEYLSTLVERLQGVEPIEFSFNGEVIRIALAVISDPQRFVQRGIGFYKKKARESISAGTRLLYILSMGTLQSSRAMTSHGPLCLMP